MNLDELTALIAASAGVEDPLEALQIVSGKLKSKLKAEAADDTLDQILAKMERKNAAAGGPLELLQVADCCCFCLLRFLLFSSHSLSPILVFVVVMGSMELKIARVFSCSFSDFL